jgi:hypothetical protein
MVLILMGQLKMIINKSTKGVIFGIYVLKDMELEWIRFFGKWRGEFLEKNLPLKIAEHLSRNFS